MGGMAYFAKTSPAILGMGLDVPGEIPCQPALTDEINGFIPSPEP
jgi:hypothetical protein